MVYLFKGLFWSSSNKLLASEDASTHSTHLVATWTAFAMAVWAVLSSLEAATSPMAK